MRKIYVVFDECGELTAAFELKQQALDFAKEVGLDDSYGEVTLYENVEQAVGESL